ncbi:MAG: PKD domain-containing protein [Bacteroidales bacterium]|nr:PKD domain-containing protein [Bacteroidales bacterium]MDY0286034.1 PKD domain-containing protein [Bacteroidales bacterium]
MKKYIILLGIMMLIIGVEAQQLVFSVQPEPATVCENASHSFWVETDTTEFNQLPMSYLWFENSGSGWLQLTTGSQYLVNGNMLRIFSIPISYTGNQYRCEVHIGSHVFISQAALLEVNARRPVSFIYSGQCFGEATHFTNISENVDFFQSWHWSFGDASCPDSSVYENASHFFCAPGNYRVELSGVDENGCLASSHQQVEILNVPEPWIEGEEIACSFQRNVKFFSGGNYAAYEWSVAQPENALCAFASGNNYEVLFDCGQTFTPRQLDINLTVTDENGCSASTSRSFLVLTYKSPDKGSLIQKPNDSRMLVCLVGQSENMAYHWAVTVKNQPADTVWKASTTQNFILLDHPVNTELFEYGVEVINTAENNCSSLFYLQTDEKDSDD